MLLVHRRDVIEPVEIRDGLQVGLVLDQLLGAAVKQADVWIDTRDDLAIQFQHETQHAVRRRMLGPEIDREVAKVLRLFVHGAAPAARRIANGEWRMVISWTCPARIVSAREAFCPNSRIAP